MRRQRATVADRLSQVIEVIELGRRTGLLSVERDTPLGLEEGDIYFVDGEAIYASTDALSGYAALEVLRAWEVCRFAFLFDIPRPVPNIGAAPWTSKPRQAGSLHPGGTGPHPSANLPQRSGPLSRPPTGPHHSGSLAPQAVFLPPSSPAGGQREPGEGPASLVPGRVSQPADSTPGRKSLSLEGVPAFPPGAGAAPSASLALTPYQRPRRAPNPQDVPRLAARYGLSRAHRVLLLLADGEHTVAELARLAGRSEEDALVLCMDLMRLGLVTLLS